MMGADARHAPDRRPLPQPRAARGRAARRGSRSLVGPNGAGKTNLLEALYFALTGRSFRTADRRELIPLRQPTSPAPRRRSRRRRALEPRAARRRSAAVRGPPPPARRLPGRPGGRGAPPPAGRGLLARPADAGQGPAGRAPRPPRRLHRRPLAAARDLRKRFGQALAQRNALLARVAAGRDPPSDLDPWDATLADGDGAADRGPLRGRRRSSPRPSPRRPRSSGCRAARSIAYAPRAEGGAEEIRAGLAERREADLRLGRTSWGAAPRRAQARARRPGPAPLRLAGPAADRPAGAALRRARGCCCARRAPCRCCCSTT